MKKFHLTPIIVAAAIGMTASLNAATSGVVGATTFDIPTGPTVVSFPFLKSVDFQGAVSSVAGADLDMGAAVPVPAAASYVQVLDGTDAGRIYDIASVSGNVITLAAAPAGVLAGDSIAVREHMTIGDLGTPPALTTATLLDAGGAPTIVSANFVGAWNAPGTIIMPGEGVIINNNSVWTITLYGAVSEDDVIFEAANGPQVVGNIDPVNGSADVLASVEAGAPNLTTLTELGVGGAPTVYSKNFLGAWNVDPSDNLDVSNYKSFVINTSSGVDIVNAGMVVGP